MRRPGARRARGWLLAGVTLAAIAAPASAAAQGPQWRLVAPEPPSASGPEACPDGEEAPCSNAPVELGRVGDIEFANEKRGLLITAGNGSSVAPGIWEYDGASWRELANVCGASNGRVAWAGEEEFWTISDERPGQPANGQGLLPPLEDNTLCHFAPNPTSGALEVVRSYAAPAEDASSYQAMRAAACANPGDCWFGGEPMPAPQPGAFNLHWNGSALEADANVAAHAVQDIRAFGGGLIESVALAREEVHGKDEESIEILHPLILYGISGAIFEGLRPYAAGHVPIPEYAEGSFPAALAGMRLASDVDAEGAETLWAAAGPAATPPLKSLPGVLTVLRDVGGAWSEVLGPASAVALGVPPANLEEDVVTSIAGEPSSSSAWLGLDTQPDAEDPSPTALATVAHVQANGSLTEQQLPSASERAEGVAPQGATAALACPAQNDCWLATTRGTLFHLSEEDTQTLPVDSDPTFTGPPITFRPPDEGLPQAPAAGLASSEIEEEEQVPAAPRLPRLAASESFREAVAPYSDARTRLLRGDTLELSFRLPVAARVRVVAERRKRVVASTRTRVLGAGRHALKLKLDARQWPTKLELQVHPLLALPTLPESRSTNTITTSLAPGRSFEGGLDSGVLPAGSGF